MLLLDFENLKLLENKESLRELVENYVLTQREEIFVNLNLGVDYVNNWGNESYIRNQIKNYLQTIPEINEVNILNFKQTGSTYEINLFINSEFGNLTINKGTGAVSITEAPLTNVDKILPVLFSAGPYFVERNMDFSETLPAAEGGIGKLTYSIIGDLPPGFAFDPATRVISGKSNQPGIFIVNYQAVDKRDKKTSVFFTITVEGAFSNSFSIAFE